MNQTASGSPTKEFFVGMLTRDIELNDAILDLLDNCLDGVVRQRHIEGTPDNPSFYKGFYSKISITPDSFTIEDNCGGIPRDVAEKYAFRMGRSSEKINDDMPTVGIYGIGMKRAIFKIGRSATVTTRNDGKLYSVRIPLSWATDENWDFPISEETDETILVGGGTRVTISNLNPDIAYSWKNENTESLFINSLIETIKQSYSFIIKKGFEIFINGTKVDALPINLLIDSVHSTGINPFLYTETFGNVHVNLAVGFYAPPPSPDEIDDENEMRRSSADAGWTIVCNDRVVLYNDKSYLTGWGEAGVPQYHTQFIGIRGIVVFQSNSPKDLPMTTTKRGIDTSSGIYAAVKNQMRRGLKMFTDYTNKWKGRNSEERTHSTNATTINIESLIGTKESIEAKNESVKFRRHQNGYTVIPKLPVPENVSSSKRISYNKNEDEINIVFDHICGDKSIPMTPSQIGERCFDIVLEEATKKNHH